MNKLSWIWTKIPVIIRAIIVGMLVQILGIMPIFLLLQKNVEIWNQLPWAFPVGILYLWFFVNYIRGKGWPKSTILSRKESFRVNSMDSSVQFWAIISGCLFSITLAGMIIWGWLFAEWPLEQIERLKTFAECPKWTILPLLFMAVLATGIIEESSYRGYMQVPIEKRHNPTVAIIIVAIVFAVSHPLPNAILPFFIIGSLGWGVLAYLSNSNLPGMIVHTMVDLTFFTWGLYNFDTLETMQRYSVLNSGLSFLFVLTVSASIVFGAATIFSFIKLAKVNKNLD